MTECENAELRDLLPDYVAERLDVSVSATVAQHLATCSACESEVALLRVARAVRPQAVHIDVDRIVSRLAPSLNQAAVGSTADASNLIAAPDVAVASVVSISTARRRRSNRGMWQIAAAVGVVALGSLSVLMARSGVVGLPIAVRSDTAQLGEAAERGLRNSSPIARTGLASGETADSSATTKSPQAVGETTSGTALKTAGATKARAAVVSVGDLSDYTDAELQKLLERLEKWDGASSSEVMPSIPIVRIGGAGANE